MKLSFKVGDKVRLITSTDKDEGVITKVDKKMYKNLNKTIYTVENDKFIAEYISDEDMQLIEKRGAK